MDQKVVPVVIGVIKKDGKYLMTKRQEWDVEDYEGLKNTPWQIPGGGLEFGEEVEECLKREMKEETGIDVVVERMLPKVYHEVRGGWHGIFLCYLCRMKDENQPVVINNEASDWGWFTLDEIRNMPCLPLTFEVAQLAL